MPSAKQLIPVVVVSLFVVAAFPGSVGADAIGEPELEAAFTDNTVSPGDDTTLTLDIINQGRIIEGFARNPQAESRVTTARGLMVTVESGDAPLSVETGPQAVGSVPEGAGPSLSIPVSVDANADPGLYEVPVTFEYTHTRVVEGDGDQRQDTLKRTVDVPVRIKPDAELTVRGVDSELRVGSTDTVAVTVENTGSDTARSATLIAESNNADITFGTSGQATRQLGDWAPGETRTVAYEVTATRSAEQQRYALDLSAQYRDADGVTRTSQTETVALMPAPEQTFSIVDSENTTAVGDTGTLSVTMRNDGPLSVTDATVELSSASENIQFEGSTTASRFVGRWAPNETRTVTYDLTATEDAEPRGYALEAVVEYRDEEDDLDTAPSRSLGVTPAAEQSFAVGDTSASLSVGSEGTLRGTVTNTGERAATNAVVVYTSESSTVTPIETTAPVGTLEPGASASFALPLEIASSAEAGPKQFTVAVEYRNADDEQRRSDTFDIRATVGPDDPVFDLDTEGATVSAGDSTQLRVTVTNDGEKRVDDVSAKLFAESPLSTSDDEAFISELAPGASETITFEVSASGSALAKDYPLSMDFRYDESDGDTLTSDTYRLPLTVTRDSGGGGGFPLLPVAAIAVLGTAIGAYVIRRN